MKTMTHAVPEWQCKNCGKYLWDRYQCPHCGTRQLNLFTRLLP